VHIFVTDHANHAADEGREARDLGDAEASHFLFNEFQWVGGRGEGFLAAIAVDFLGAVFPGGDREGWARAAEAIAADVLAASDRFKEETGPLAAQAGVDGDWRLQVGHQVEADRHDIAGAGELAEGGLVWD
jgi:hypothetical protein